MPAAASGRAASWGVLAAAAWPQAGCFEYDPNVRMESARLFGNMNKYAYYFTDIMVGQPSPQRASVIVDTGSRLVGFPCSNCGHCGNHIDPAFDISRSRSAAWFNCSDSCPQTCMEQRCPYRETYAEGSTISGFWFEDLVALGDSFSKNPPIRVRLGCHDNENKLFYSQRANGIMGLAPSTGSLSQPTILQQMFQDKEHINTRLFSICLATWGGRMTIGGYNTSVHLGPPEESIQWINMRATHYYFVSPEGMMLIDDTQAVEVTHGSSDFGVTIVDSGTTYTYLPEAIFNSLIDHLDGYCRGHGDCGADKEGDRCWRLRGAEAGPSMFPPLAIHFGGGVHINWMPESYLQQRGEDALWCRTFMQNSIFQTVLGISLMLHKDFIFDIGRSRLGVADAKCPEYYEQPSETDEGFEQKFSRDKLPPAAPRLGASMRSVSLLAADTDMDLAGSSNPTGGRGAAGATGAPGPSQSRASSLLSSMPPEVVAASLVAALGGVASLAVLCAVRVKRRAAAASASLGTMAEGALLIEGRAEHKAGDSAA